MFLCKSWKSFVSRLGCTPLETYFSALVSVSHRFSLQTDHVEALPLHSCPIYADGHRFGSAVNIYFQNTEVEILWLTASAFLKNLKRSASSFSFHAFLYTGRTTGFENLFSLFKNATLSRGCPYIISAWDT